MYQGIKVPVGNNLTTNSTLLDLFNLIATTLNNNIQIENFVFSVKILEFSAKQKYVVIPLPKINNNDSEEKEYFCIYTPGDSSTTLSTNRNFISIALVDEEKKNIIFIQNSAYPHYFVHSDTIPQMGGLSTGKNYIQLNDEYFKNIIFYFTFDFLNSKKFYSFSYQCYYTQEDPIPLDTLDSPLYQYFIISMKDITTNKEQDVFLDLGWDTRTNPLFAIPYYVLGKKQSYLLRVGRDVKNSNCNFQEIYPLDLDKYESEFLYIIFPRYDESFKSQLYAKYNNECVKLPFKTININNKEYYVTARNFPSYFFPNLLIEK